MNKKNILVFSMALSIVGGSTAAVFATENAVHSTKNNVVTVASKAGNGTNQTTVAKVANGKISEAEAVKMATKALKDYMGLDAKSFGEARVSRFSNQDNFKFYMGLVSKEDAAVLKENAKKHTANVLRVVFAKDENKPASAGPASVGAQICINEETGEIVELLAFNSADRSSETTIDDAKVKSAVINFFDKQQKNVKENTMKVSKTANNGFIEVLCDLEDERDVRMNISLKNYSVTSYEINYDRLLPLPSTEKNNRENFRGLKVN